MHFVPNFFPGKNNPWNGNVSYWVLAAIYVGLMVKIKVPSLKYFRAPALDWKTLLGLFVAVGIVWQQVDVKVLAHKSVWALFTGAVFLFTIGLAEEIVSRGFVYGIFTRFGQKFAIVFSSVLFGALHLSWYMGAYWDPWAAYWHVSNAVYFGYFLCCLMIACRSMWPAIVMHAVWDWDLGFNFAAIDFPKPGHVTHSAFWSGLAGPLWLGVPLVVFGTALVYLRRGVMPGFARAYALRFKLI